MTHPWREVPLSEVADLQDGPFGSNLKSSDYVDDGVRVVRLQNVGVGSFVDRDKAFVSEQHFAGLRRHECRSGDVLVATLGDPIIRACELPAHVPVALNKADCVRARTRENAVVGRFLVHWLNSPAFQAKASGMAHGQTRPRVNLSQLRQSAMPLPPVEEQRRIAAILDAADEVRAKRRESLALADSLTEAIFLDMFGDPSNPPSTWRREAIGALVRRIESGKSPVCLSRPAALGEWAVLKLGAVTWGEFKEGENKALPPDVAPDETLEVHPGDLLFTRKNTRELVGATAIAYDPRSRLLLSDLIFRLDLSPDSGVEAEYLHRLLSCKAIRQAVQRLAGGSAGSMPNISKARLASFTVALPDASEQREFAERARAVRQSVAAARDSSVHMDELFGTLQQRAFRGEL